MPIDFAYDSGLRILFAKATGLITVTDIQRHLDLEGRANALRHRELIDASSAYTNITTEEVRAVVRSLKDLMGKGQFGPTALVTPNDNLFGMASMASIISSLQGGPEVGVFRGFDEALDWLLRA